MALYPLDISGCLVDRNTQSSPEDRFVDDPDSVLSCLLRLAGLAVWISDNEDVELLRHGRQDPQALFNGELLGCMAGYRDTAD